MQKGTHAYTENCCGTTEVQQRSGERMVFPIIGSGTTGYSYWKKCKQKIEPLPYPTAHKNSHPRWIINLNVTEKTVNLKKKRWYWRLSSCL